MPSVKLIKLREPRKNYGIRDERFTQTAYTHGAPFFDNPRGVLIHRVREIVQLEATFSKHPWWIVRYWCENHGRTNSEDDGLVFDPGKKYICKRCESLATASGEQTSSEIAGRHVHTGTLKAVQACCLKKEGFKR